MLWFLLGLVSGIVVGQFITIKFEYSDDDDGYRGYE